MGMEKKPFYIASITISYLLNILSIAHECPRTGMVNTESFHAVIGHESQEREYFPFRS